MLDGRCLAKNMRTLQVREGLISFAFCLGNTRRFEFSVDMTADAATKRTHHFSSHT